MGDWIDISVPLHTGMVHWPGDPEPIIERLMEMERGDAANVSFIKMSAHTGTHVDAGFHFLSNGSTMDEFPLHVGIGPARVLDMGNASSVGSGELEKHDVQPGERILLKTRHSRGPWHDQEFNADLVALTAAGARYLADKKTALVGVDYLSVGAYEGDGDETHRILLGSGVWVLEGLYLDGVEPGSYELICLPLKMQGADGAPARAVVRRV